MITHYSSFELFSSYLLMMSLNVLFCSFLLFVLVSMLVSFLFVF